MEIGMVKCTETECGGQVAPWSLAPETWQMCQGCGHLVLLRRPTVRRLAGGGPSLWMVHPNTGWEVRDVAGFRVFINELPLRRTVRLAYNTVACGTADEIAAGPGEALLLLRRGSPTSFAVWLAGPTEEIMAEAVVRGGSS